MKKLLLGTILIGMLFLMSACTKQTFENPDSTYCTAGAVEDVYLCRKTYTQYFDTTITMTFYVTPEDTYSLTEQFSHLELVLSEYHKLLDKYHEYTGVVNVYSINNRTSSSVTISQKLFDAISFGLAHENDIQVEGVSLFNIALGPVLNIWHDSRESDSCEGVFPLYCDVPRSLIDGQTFPTDSSKIVLDESNLTISFLEDGMEIDLGGYGKGYVSEILSDYFDQIPAKYILNVGNSNVKAGGINPNNSDGLYYIALERPQLTLSVGSSYYAYIKVPSDMAVVTSGNNQRFFIGKDDDLVYHHIIDPRTNYPGGEAYSVTILTEDGGLADVYSTAIFLMTVSEGLDYVNSTEGLVAIWYLSDGTVVQSDGFETYLYQLL